MIEGKAELIHAAVDQYLAELELHGLTPEHPFMSFWLERIEKALKFTKSPARVRGEKTLLLMGENLEDWEEQDFYPTYKDGAPTRTDSCRFHLHHPDPKRGYLAAVKFWNENQLFSFWDFECESVMNVDSEDPTWAKLILQHLREKAIYVRSVVS